MSFLQSAARGRGEGTLRPAFGARCAAAVISLLGAAVVQAKNSPPVIWGTPIKSVLATKHYSFQPTARDANGDRMWFSVGNRPSWATLDSGTGRLYGTPARGDSGTYKNITIYVSDGKTRSALQPFNLKVIGVIDRAPAITGNPPNSVTVGQGYVFKPVARDPEGQRIVFSIRNKPAWLSFDTATGTIKGAPGPNHVGTYRNIVLSASDGSASANLPAFSVTVRAPSTVGTRSSVTVDWLPPIQNTDASSLMDLVGYRIHYGTTRNSLDRRIDLRNPGLTRYVMDDLPAGRWYFALTAYNRAGAESDLSEIAATDIR
jgi:putative Ig domain-containing protein